MIINEWENKQTVFFEVLITNSINADVFYHTQVLRNPLSVGPDENKGYTRKTSLNRSATETNY